MPETAPSTAPSSPPGLTLSAIASPRTPIPLLGLAQLWESGARFRRRSVFWLFRRAWDMTQTTYGLWLAYCVSAPTLGFGACTHAGEHRLSPDGHPLSPSITRNDVAVLRYHPAWPGQFPHHSDHVAGSAVRLMRSYLGSDWHPAGWKSTTSATPTGVASKKPSARKCALAQDTTGVAVSQADLLRPRATKPGRALTLDDVALEAAVIPQPEPLRSVLNCRGLPPARERDRHRRRSGTLWHRRAVPATPAAPSGSQLPRGTRTRTPPTRRSVAASTPRCQLPRLLMRLDMKTTRISPTRSSAGQAGHRPHSARQRDPGIRAAHEAAESGSERDSD